MATFEWKNDEFTGKKIRGFGSGNFAECFKIASKYLHIINLRITGSKLEDKWNYIWYNYLYTINLRVTGSKFEDKWNYIWYTFSR